MKIVLLYGGKSPEHEISVLTAKDIMANLDYAKYSLLPVYINREGEWRVGPELDAPVAKSTNFYLELGEKAVLNPEGERSIGEKWSIEKIFAGDCLAFPALHGPGGEDGSIQGLCETLDVPYVGAGILTSSLGLDKIASKHLFLQAQIPQVPFVAMTAAEFEEDAPACLSRIEGKLVYPLFVKPANLGSSIGISRVESRNTLLEALELAFRYDQRIVIEQGVEARELEVGVIGDDKAEVSVVGELIKAESFYDYDAKYINNETDMAIPSDVPEAISSQIQAYAKQAFRCLGGRGLMRCDFFLTHQGNIYINEVNTMPGFTQFSMFPSLWEATGLSYSKMLDRLIEIGLKAHHR